MVHFSGGLSVYFDARGKAIFKKRPYISAFSFIELLITTAVVSTGLLALIGVLAFAARASRTGEMASLAQGHSVHLIELIRSRNLAFSGYTVPPNGYSGLNDTAAERRELDAFPFEADLEAGTPFRRNITITRMGTAGQYNYNVVNIVCSVYWQENGEDRSVTLEAQHRRP